MNKDENNGQQTTYNQMAWILNYQPTIGEQHIHMGNQTVEDKPIGDEAEYEEVEEEKAAAPAEAEERKREFASAVVNMAKVDAIVDLLCQLMEGKTKPKDVMMPIRAAIDAGVIRRPTWEEFCSEFGKDRIKSKASFSDYTNPENKPYDGADFETMKEAFQAL